MTAKALPNTKKVDVINRRECRVGISIEHIDSADALSPGNASESFENTCLDPIGHQVHAPKFPIATMD